MTVPARALRVLPLGGCMLGSAIAEPRRLRILRNTFVDMGHDWPTCYSVHEAIRALKFYRGEVNVPRELRHFCALPVDFDPVTEGGERFEDADFVLLEPNTNLYHMFDGLPITRAEIDRHILVPLKELGGPVGEAAATWLRYGLLDCNEQTQLETAAVLLPELDGRVDNPDLARRILLETRSVNPDRETYFAAIAELRDMIRKPLGLVTFTFQYLPNGRGMAWPPDFVENTMEAARQLDIPCFHPAALVKKYGVKAALKDDRQFYQPEFESVIGEEILKFCHALLAGGTKVMNASSPQLLDSAAQSVASDYAPASLKANRPLAYVDFARPLLGWNVFRASLSDGAMATPVQGVVARKLVEAVTPEAATHDVRGYVANPAAARRFRLALIARADERDQLRLWLGTGGPSSGAERIDVTFDLKTGKPFASHSTNTWRIRDASSEALGEGWHLCWIIGESEAVLPDVFVLVTTSVARGSLPLGDGKSGLWVGGLRLDALNDEASEKAVQVRLSDNRRDLADLVSDEILAFLREEFEAAGDIYQWYRTRYLANNIGLSRIDREIASFVMRRFGTTRKTLEVGAGVAQCSQLLALSGVHTAAVEASSVHFDMMRRLVDRLGARFDPRLAERIRPLRGFYPDDVVSAIDSKTLVIVPSLGSTFTPEQEIKAFDALRPADGVILGVRMFFRTRESEDQRRAMIEEIQRRGFGEPEEVFSWDDWSFGFAPDRIIYLPKI